MRHAHDDSRAVGVRVARCDDVGANEGPNVGTAAAGHHVLLDEHGRQVGRITGTSTPLEFGRLEPTLLLRRNGTLPATRTPADSDGLDSERQGETP